MRPTDIVHTPFNDGVFAINVPSLKFGMEATHDVGYEAKRLGMHHALIVVDPHLQTSSVYDTVKKALNEEGIEISTTAMVRVEPEDTMVMEAFNTICGKVIDGFVSVGGGSTIDTAKMLNLLYSYPRDLLDYVNKPIGQGINPPGPLKPHIAIPTTAGTGSESTSVAILDISAIKVKSGISHRYLRPDVAIIDPLNTLSLPPMVTASAGLDVLNHAIESFTAHPYTARAKVQDPANRPVYVGSTPIGDIFAIQAVGWVHNFIRRAVAQPYDVEARYYMMLGASIAGIGFGHAGVHIPHAMGYPIAGMVRAWAPQDYAYGYALSPHGISTAIPAAYVFRNLANIDFDRFEQIADVLSLRGESIRQLSDNFFEYYIELLTTLGIPTTLKELDFSPKDVDKLVEGTMAQQRLLSLAPIQVTEDVLKRLFDEAIVGS
ncbi:MAG: alcohol dehydrogenase [Sulfobacillus benefaciens]|uniref:hydroxyacid-oxoacid transhydrogenase n=1 Tax=Sulfobacillus benefaciens TaxID=453960 RepID=A0A2T2WUK8_9FIRM|nr:MAG: alcohol dehydrogenase [Sulfobacillus benefaciens]HBQ95652.1 alcohol dehydrogenase [Sulfobacillus sp.]